MKSKLLSNEGFCRANYKCLYHCVNITSPKVHLAFIVQPQPRNWFRMSIYVISRWTLTTWSIKLIYIWNLDYCWIDLLVALSVGLGTFESNYLWNSDICTSVISSTRFFIWWLWPYYQLRKNWRIFWLHSFLNNHDIKHCNDIEICNFP